MSANHPGPWATYFGFNILSALFGVLSLGLVGFFDADLQAGAVHSRRYPPRVLCTINPLDLFQNWIYELIQTPGGNIRALMVISACGIRGGDAEEFFSTYMSMYFSTRSVTGY